MWSFTMNFELKTELVDVSNNSFQSSTNILLSWLIHLLLYLWTSKDICGVLFHAWTIYSL